MSQTPDKPRPTHAPVRFDDRIFQEDLAYASVTGIAVARLSGTATKARESRWGSCGSPNKKDPTQRSCRNA